MYRIEFRKAAVRALRKLEPDIQARIRGAVTLLAVDPRPPGTRKLSNRDAYRLRIGAYRLIYTVQDDRLIVVIVAAGHRSTIYR